MIELVKWSLFILLSIGIIVFFWKSLQQVYSHGFFRFFVFEAIIGLILVNSSYWFADPFSLLQILSWVLLFGSLATGVYGLYLLRITRKTRGSIDNTSMVAKNSVYKYFRHPFPFYWALLLLAVSTFLKQISAVSIFILLIAIAFLVITVKVEEHEKSRVPITST